MKVTAKLILVAILAMIVLSIISAIVMPAIVVFIDSGELDFSHLQNLLELVFAYFVFGPPILTSGTLAVLAFIIMKDRLGTQKSALVAFGSFVIFSFLLTILAVQVVIRGLMFVIDSS
ncbi:MAG: hypothetical protein U9N80_07570 [Chloroflexota bacterium]|nr:hypothetical protein [Chloroflexota bacterium]